MPVAIYIHKQSARHWRNEDETKPSFTEWTMNKNDSYFMSQHRHHSAGAHFNWHKCSNLIFIIVFGTAEWPSSSSMAAVVAMNNMQNTFSVLFVTCTCTLVGIRSLFIALFVRCDSAIWRVVCRGHDSPFRQGTDTSTLFGSESRFWQPFPNVRRRHRSPSRPAACHFSQCGFWKRDISQT